MKKSIVLLELIFAIVLFSIISIITSKTILKMYKKDFNTRNILNTNLQLESTRLYIIKQNNLNNITFKNNKLFYDDNLLLKDVTKFAINKTIKYNSVVICIKNICQNWKFNN